ncbi:MAG TPA: NAD(P)/FAD-dependent oxidoreductase [Bryobacteraceae bacterium]|nr:NAD(P)/FAD-dependent oxidoreductase [Bryobacteraceae bacterium]
MDACDVLIVGGGPAGSSCAWKLSQAGFDVAVIDKQNFPRNKVCGGWITPAVLEELEIDPLEYARGRVLQPITGFRTCAIGGREIETHYDAPVSYGIRRFEFDDYLLKRSRARLFEGRALEELTFSNGRWTVNGQIRTPMLIGAGGTFCPVARLLGAKVSREAAVTAQEAEFQMDQRQLARCSIRGEVPELFFCPDMKGYGWCFRKANVLNVGLGRLDRRALGVHVANFLRFLKRAGKLSFDLPQPPLGHAYLLYASTTRKIVDDGVLLIGDAAGVAYAQSGEGIRPAIESGLLAAQAVAAARGDYTRERLALYRDLMFRRFGSSEKHWATGIGRRLPSELVGFLGRRLLATRWFAREVVLDRWFLRQGEPALDLSLPRALENNYLVSSRS